MASLYAGGAGKPTMGSARVRSGGRNGEGGKRVKISSGLLLLVVFLGFILTTLISILANHIRWKDLNKKRAWKALVPTVTLAAVVSWLVLLMTGGDSGQASSSDGSRQQIVSITYAGMPQSLPAPGSPVETIRNDQQMSVLPSNTAAGQKPAQSFVNDVDVKVSGACGHDAFSGESVKQSILSSLKGSTVPTSSTEPGAFTIAIVGGTEDDMSEGNATSVKAYGSYRICRGENARNCPQPTPPSCDTSCRFGDGSSLSANRELANDRLAEEISNRMKSVEFTFTQTLEGGLCGF